MSGIPASRLPTEGVVLGMHHVQLSYPAHQQARVAQFYGGLLGLPCVVQTAAAHAQLLSYLAGSQRIDLLPRITTQQPCECLGHLALQVSGIEALHQRLLDHGATALAVVQVAEGLRFYAKDPAGNTLELLQPQAVQAARPRSQTAAQRAPNQEARVPVLVEA